MGFTVRRIITPADKRRSALRVWLGERAAHNDLTASEIADVSGIYDRERHPHARCFDDLKVLEAYGHAYREGRPARWWLR